MKYQDPSKGCIEFSVSARHLSGGSIEGTVAYSKLEIRREAFARENMNVVGYIWNFKAVDY